ncbi:MAG: hypothetical protein KBT47_03745, partial [Armatimonadetes bacterium]|nr:hypothetical protein [Candidatus Hippobium faecium]
MKIAEYGIGNWKVDGRGNHRAVVRVSESCPVVLAELCWRRHDENPETKDIMVENEKGERVSRKVISVTKEKGLVAFEAQTEGLYYIYYLPFVQPREFFVPKTPYFRAGSLDYTKPIKALGDNPILKEEEKFDTESFPVLSELGYNENIDYPKAELVRIEARGEFNSMYPMEVPATDEEYNSLTEGRKDFMVFAEDRINQIRMKDAVPYKWYESGEVLSLEGEARPNEIWTFQIGVLALSDIKNLRLEFSDFGGLSASDFHCINMGGKDWLGREFKKEINVKKDRVQAMWVYVDIPKNAEKEYKGTVYVKADNCETREAKLNISVRGEVLDDKGFSDLWRMSRLAWLDSDMAIDDTVVPPY